MKRNYLILAAVCLAVGITACSPKSTETTASQTTEAVSETVPETSGETESASESETELEEETTEASTEPEKTVVTGQVVYIEKTVVTISGQDDQEYQVDLADAETRSDLEIGEGDELQVVFLDDGEAVKKAESYDILSSVAMEGDMDPVVSGVIQDASMNTITIQAASGKVYHFSTINAQTVTGENGITIGGNVEITYLGSLPKEGGSGTALRVITEEGAGDADATYKAMEGILVSVSESVITIQAADETQFSFALDGSIDVSEMEAGEAVEITYEGSLTKQNAIALDVDY